ncbi:MAG: CPBP family intramembrane glutamic endopeptidase [Opitutaceae bacterium]
MGEKDQNSVAAIQISISSVAAYVAYIGIGLAIGIIAIILVGRQFGPTFGYFGSEALLYAAAVFAHFRFAYGVSNWPRLEKGDITRTVLWALFLVIVGFYAISGVGRVWAQRFQGVDDSIHLRPEESVRSYSRYISGFPAIILVGINVCIVAPIAEEIIFRSGLYRILKGKMSVASAAIVSSLVFAITHRSAVAVAPLFLLGFLSCWIYEKTTDIRGPMIFHAGYNFLVCLPALVRMSQTA